MENKAVDALTALGVIDETAIKAAETAAYPHFLHVMAVLFVLNVIIMLVIGKLYPREEAYEQHYTEDIDITPWSLVKPLGGVICAIVVGVYIYFS